MKKRFLCALLALAMLTTVLAISIPVLAAEPVSFSVSSDTVAAVPGQSIQVQIRVSGTGISLLQFKIELDSGLEWDGFATYNPAPSQSGTWPFVPSSEAMTLSGAPSGANFDESSIIFVYMGPGGGNSTSDGLLVTLKLKVKEDASSGANNVTMNIDFCQDEDEVPITYDDPSTTPSVVSVTAVLNGTASISGTAKVGETLTASIDGSPTLPLHYQWKAGGTNIGIDDVDYTVQADDVGKTITVTITSAVDTGSATSAPTVTVVKQDAPTAPGAPVLSSKSSTSVTLVTEAGCEYSIDGTTWQPSTTFDSLSPSTTYTFYQRIAETAGTLASAASLGLTETTLTPVTFTAVQTGGAISTADSTAIEITFSESVSNLAVGSIIITNDTGDVTLSTFGGSGTTYTIDLASVTAQGNVFVEVIDFDVYDVTTTAQTIAVYKDITAPAISGGSVDRTSDTNADIGFTTTEAGTAYYLVLAKGTAAPTKTAIKSGTSLGLVAKDANSGIAVTLSAGAMDIYVVVEDVAGNISEPLKISVADYNVASYSVTVSGAGIGYSGEGTYAEDDTVNITAGTEPDGQVFTGWTSDDVDFDDASAESTFFTMPDQNVTVKANYTDITYIVTVSGGTGGGNYKAGDLVSITATVPSGKVFDKWTTADGVTFASATAASTTFTMPANNVTVTATFKTSGGGGGGGVSVDKTALNAGINALKDTQKGDYTDASWATYQAALTNAQTVLANTSVTQKQVDDALKALNDGFAALKEKDGVPPAEVDKDALNSCIAALEDTAKGDYTDASWDAFQTALTNAEAVSANGSATQAQVDAALRVLEAAYAALKENTVPQLPAKLVGLFGFNTKYESTTWNWIKFIVLFGWVWMWFI